MTKMSPRRLARRAFMKTASATHTAIYRSSGGRVGGRMAGMPVLLLTTTGRRSGKSRTTPLLFVRDGHAWVVVGSNGGSDYIPAWWLNLRSNPDGQVEVGRERIPVVAHKASAGERARLWPEFTSQYAGYAKYAARAPREIPVVILEPR
jgi:F420H(2)-dependent quinone reductase